MKPTYVSLSEWLTTCRNITHNDLDNVILFAGEPGNGKSTLAVQLARALDPTFNLERVTFTVQDFIAVARKAEKHTAILADELLVNRRKAMSRDSKDLLDFLQVCRGLNLHLLLCFPHAAMLDRAVLEHRVRYRVDVASKEGRRLAHVTERMIRTVRNGRGEEEYAVTWKPALNPFAFDRNSGVFWEEYLAKKVTAARAREDEARGSTPGEEESTDPIPVRVRRAPRNAGGKMPTFRVRETSPLHGILPERSPPESEQRRKPLR